jgi:hypothetical protein
MGFCGLDLETVTHGRLSCRPSVSLSLSLSVLLGCWDRERQIYSQWTGGCDCDGATSPSPTRDSVLLRQMCACFPSHLYFFQDYQYVTCYFYSLCCVPSLWLLLQPLMLGAVYIDADEVVGSWRVFSFCILWCTWRFFVMTLRFLNAVTISVRWSAFFFRISNCLAVSPMAASHWLGLKSCSLFLDPLKAEFILNNIYKFSSYLTGKSSPRRRLVSSLWKQALFIVGSVRNT